MSSALNKRRGNAVLESVMVMPILLGLLVGAVSLARITYTYSMLHRMMYNLARYLGTQQGVNFCDSQDPAVQDAISYALTGSGDSSGTPIVPNLTPGMFQVRIERYDPNSQQLVICDCTSGGCDASQGGQPPGFIVVSLTNGYTVAPTFWGFAIDPFPLRPSVRVPYGGT